jgi:ribosomal protein L37AE/L43A
MQNYFDSQNLTFNCPKCGKEIRESVSRLKHKGYTCPHCGTPYDTSNFASGIADAERSIQEAFSNLGPIKINLKL